MLPIALTIAGSDPSGGAGIQADLKTFHQFGVYGEAVITLVTVQNTSGVRRVEVLDDALVKEQIESVIEDMPPRAAKTGALGSAEVASAVAQLAQLFSFPLVVDPVMFSKHGARLLSSEAETVLCNALLPPCTLVTPNIAEAEALSGARIATVSDMEEAARTIAKLGPKAVLVKGGHLEGEPVDVLYSAGNFRRFTGRRVPTRNTHGTGCTYSAAITASLAHGESLETAVSRAKQFVQSAIESAPGFGRGFGPLNHFART
jgi:hydroxymethylpyrimidine/phosphomethylpyrimidine kinase